MVVAVVVAVVVSVVVAVEVFVVSQVCQWPSLASRLNMEVVSVVTCVPVTFVAVTSVPVTSVLVTSELVAVPTWVVMTRVDRVSNTSVVVVSEVMVG